MLINLSSGRNIWLLGDPHLGRRFETGVPLHRRGEREAKQFDQFEAELNIPDVDWVVCVGDLFDHPHVGYHVVLKTYELLRDAKNHVILLGGNHDEPRKTDVKSAIDLLEALCEHLEHVTIVRHNPVQIDEMALFPWNWIMTAEEQVHAFQQSDEVRVAIGHWDLIDFGGDTNHMAPTRAIRESIGTDVTIYTGHYHLEGTFEVDGVSVHCTGSMQPYSHGEDPNGDVYVTLTLAELEATDEKTLHDKCVRVLLAEGEELPSDLDCLALTAKRLQSEAVELEQIDTTSFSWKDILSKSLEDVAPHVRTFIEDKLKEHEE